MNLLYHYTNQNGFLGIISEKSMWMSNLHYLNDSIEYHYPLDLLRSQIGSIDPGTSLQAIILPEAVEVTRKNVFQGIIDLLYDDIVIKVPIYVSCFSENGDQLGQWRGYSDSGIGFSLGFDRAELEGIAKANNYLLQPCIYEKSDQINPLNALIEKMPKLVERKNLPKIRTEFIFDFWSIAPTLKHFSFKEEREWRLFSKALGTKQEDVSCRQGKSMIIPYIKLKFEDLGIIKKIVIGPTPHQGLSKNSARTFLSSRGVEKIEIVNSEVPYRSW
ncbi:MAG: DUF2971 domain-containing protein [Syntrophales bacterium]